MEFKLYLRMLLRKWWVVVLALVITSTATLVFSLNQQPVYEASATYVVRPGESYLVEKDFISALETISRRVEIGATYAEVANSNLIRERAFTSLGLSSPETRNISVDSKLVAGTNIMVVIVQANNLDLARQVADMIGSQTVEYVASLYDVFQLELLDAASGSDTPVQPRIKFNLMLSAALGLILGVGLVFVSEYLQSPAENRPTFDIIDRVSGVYNRAYLMLRLTQEISRSKRHGYSLALAVIKIYPDALLDQTGPGLQQAVVRKVAVLLEHHLRDEDVLSLIDEATFAVLFPDITGRQAKEIVDALRLRVFGEPLELSSFGGMRVALSSSASVLPYENTSLDAAAYLAQAVGTVSHANPTTHGKAHLIAPKDAHHRHDEVRVDDETKAQRVVRSFSELPAPGQTYPVISYDDLTPVMALRDSFNPQPIAARDDSAEQIGEAGAYCPHEDCPDYNEPERGNIIRSGLTASGVQRYMCKTCGRTFTETKGTLFYRKRTPPNEILETLALLAGGAPLDHVAELKGFQEETILAWLREASEYTAQLEQTLVDTYGVSPSGLETMWTFINYELPQQNTEV